MGKGGEKDTLPTTNEVIIDGRCYDITGMKHPGGSVIKYYAGNGIDASQAFANFHVRSTKAKNYLKSLPSRPYVSVVEKIPGQNALLEDFEQLTKDLTAEGYFKPSVPHMIYRFSEIILWHIAGMWLLLNGHPIPGLMMLGIISGRCGWLMHEGGHYSLTGNIAFDKMCQVILFGVGCGMSGSWWRIQHNKHHSMPQKLGHDVDLNTLPLVAFATKVVKRIGFPLKVWIRMQAVMFPVITTLLVALGWQFYLHPRHILRTKNVSEGLAVVTRYALWSYFITSRFGLTTSICMFLFYDWFAANYIFINFAVSHTHLPVAPKDDTEIDWVRYSAIYTMNVKPGPLHFINWWMSYLNFQIEHHLYPSMPQYRFPRISHRVRALFEKHGLVYDQRSYTEALRVTFANLDKVGQEVFLG